MTVNENMSDLQDLSSASESTENFSNNPSFDAILSARLSRRSVLKGSFGVAATAVLGGSLSPSYAATKKSSPLAELQLNFNAVAKNKEDKLTLAEGYSWSLLLQTGDPISANATPYANDGSDSAQSFTQRAGDHHDGMHFFG